MGRFLLTQYLDGELEREEAIERIGRTSVEREQAFVEEDVDWGLHACRLASVADSDPSLISLVRTGTATEVERPVHYTRIRTTIRKGKSEAGNMVA